MWKLIIFLFMMSCGENKSNSIISDQIILEENFSTLSSDRWLTSNGYTNGGVFDCDWDASHSSVTGGELKLKLDDQPTLYTCGEIRSQTKYSYGRYEVRMKAAANPGIVSTFFTYNSAPHDEIDIEFLGKNPTVMQVNYFKNGVGGNEQIIALGFDASAAFHTYAFEWRENSIKWFVDGNLIHTVTGSSATLPSNPGYVYMNIWNGIGVDAWLDPFTYSVPLAASYDWVKISR